MSRCRFAATVGSALESAPCGRGETGVTHLAFRSPVVLRCRHARRAAMPEYATTPHWVTKRDGRVVPFESDKVCRAIFSATEELGRPDAFLARELTDGVLHFLAADLDGGDTASTTQIAATAVKVVR